MLGRREFATAGLAAGAMAAMHGGAARAAEHGDHGHGKEKLDECAEACAECQVECNSCATHCLSMLKEGKKEHFETAQTCLDCATICAAASEVVARGGPFADLICTACADACEKCAKACEEFPDDKHMKKCAEECRECEKECRAMLGSVAQQ